METSGRVYTPGQAAQVLGVTTQTLRRYAEDYGEVFEPVVQHNRQRVFDDAFVARLQQAQAMQQANTAPSIRVALEYVRDGSAPADAIAHPEHPPFEQAVLEQLGALAEMVARQSEENRELHERLRQLEAPRGGADRDVELEEQRRLNQYLLGELERRRLEAEQAPTRRPWWQLWRR